MGFVMTVSLEICKVKIQAHVKIFFKESDSRYTKKNEGEEKDPSK